MKRRKKEFFYGWINLGILWLSYMLISVPFTYAFGIVVSDMAKSIRLTMTLAAGGYTCYQLSGALMTPLIGKLVVRFGPKKIFLSGCILMSLAASLMTYVVHGALLYYFVWIFLFSYGFRSAGLLPSQVILANWFFKKRGLAMAILLTAGGIGGYIFTPLLQWLNDLYSWRSVWATIAVLNFFAFFMLSLLLRERPEDVHQKIDNGKEYPQENIEIKTDRFYKSEDPWTLKQVMRTPQMYILIVVFFTVSYFVTTVANYAFNHLTLMGIDSSMAAKAVGYFALINTAGRVIVGLCGDYFGTKYVAIAGTAFATIGSLLMLRTSTFSSALIALVFLGIGCGVLMVAPQTLLVDYYGTCHYTEINSMFNMVSGLISSLPTIIIGFYYDMMGNYQSAWYFGASFAALSFILLGLTKAPKYKY